MSAATIRLRLGYFIAAAVFLFNPNFNILDVLPDCIGYLLLLRGLGETDLLVPHFEDSKKNFRYLFWLTLSRIPMYFVVSAMTHGDSDLGVMFTLISFVYGVVELLLVIPAFKSFFEGMEFLAERHGAFSLAGKRMERARLFTYITVIAKPILAFLPELVFLTRQDPLVAGLAPDYVRFRPHLFVASGFLMLVMGSLFLGFFIRYIAKADKEKTLSSVFEEIAVGHSTPVRGEDTHRRIGFAMTCFSFGAFCCIDIVLDRISYLPDALGGLFFLAAALLLLPLGGKPAKLTVLSSVAWAFFSAFAYYYRNSFFAKYSYESLGISKTADKLYGNYILFSGIESAFAIFAAISCALLLAKLAKEQTGYEGDSINQYASHLSLHGALCRKCTVFAVLGGLAAAVSFLEAYCGQFTAKIAHGEETPEGFVPEIAGYVTLPVLDWLWLVSFALCLAFFLYARHLKEVYAEEVRLKYDLE